MAAGACAAIAINVTAARARMLNNAPLCGGGVNIVFGEADPPKIDIYGVALAVAAGEAAGAGEPELEFTVGAFFAPCWAAKKWRRTNPNIPAIVFLWKRPTS